MPDKEYVCGIPVIKFLIKHSLIVESYLNLAIARLYIVSIDVASNFIIILST